MSENGEESYAERRYAFVYFERSEDAELARATLIKQAKWKGNVSFAKKEKDAAERHSKHSVGVEISLQRSNRRATSGWAT